MSRLRAFGFALLVLGVVACARGAPEAKTTLTSGELDQSSSADRVRSSLAAASCDRTGPSCAAPASRDACIAEQRRVLATQIDLHYCARGYEQRDIDDCAAAIRSAPCTTPVRNLTACRTDSLCQPWDEARP
jgi:hypothetical protein